MFETPEKSLKERLPEALNRIMSAEEAALHKHETNMIRFVKGEYELTYFGSTHSNRPDNPMMEAIRNDFDQAKPALVVIEGFDDLEVMPAKEFEQQKGTSHFSQDELIERGEERGLAFRLASENDLQIVSPEPSDAELLTHIQTQGGTQEDVVGFYTLRSLMQKARMNREFTNAQIISDTIEKAKLRLGLSKIEFTAETLKHRIAELTGISLEKFQNLERITHEEFVKIKELIDPIPWDDTPFTEFNRINQLITRFRDERIVEKLAEYLEKYKKVFVVYGASHLLMQKAALEYLMAD